MKSLKRSVLTILTAVSLISASLTLPLAAFGYTCTETELKVPDHFDPNIMKQKDGGLDSFWGERGSKNGQSDAVKAYCNEKNPDDPKNGTQMKLLCYTPQ